MKKYVIASSKEWFGKAEKSSEFLGIEFISIKNKDELTLQNLSKINPRFVFFPHWNWIVPKEIYEAYECVVFHTAPLPYGRGGSPIQNLIVRNIENAPVCALRMNEVLDGGPIYGSIEISLAGTCEEIFKRIAEAVQALIVDIIKNEPKPIEQKGEPIYFNRRKPSENKLPESASLTEIYNRIRMLDAAEYPKAFIEYGDFIIEFTNANNLTDSVAATVQIKRK